MRQYLANRLAALRAAKGWTQHDLAAACIDPATGGARSASWVRGYEQQQRWPDPEDIELLAAALGVLPEGLVAPAPSPTPQEALAILARELAARPAPDALAARVMRLGPLDRQYVEDLVRGLEENPSSSEPGKGAPERGK